MVTIKLCGGTLTTKRVMVRVNGVTLLVRIRCWSNRPARGYITCISGYENDTDLSAVLDRGVIHYIEDKVGYALQPEGNLYADEN